MLDAKRLEAADTAVLAGQILLSEPVVIDILQRAVGHPDGFSLVAERIVLRAHLADESGEVVLLRDASTFFRRVFGMRIAFRIFSGVM
jgi:hypothetical protein